MLASVPDSIASPHDHAVGFYDTDADLVALVAQQLAKGYQSENALLVVASRSHREGIGEALAAAGVDVVGARAAGRMLALDAAETLGRFMVGGVPDPDRFAGVIGPLVAGIGKSGRPVSAFGEMVSLLWDAGNVAGAVELERLWNELAREHRFSLFCAYPIGSLTEADDLVATSRICAHHSDVMAPASYTSATPTGAGQPSMYRAQLFVPVPEAVRAARQFVVETVTAWSEGAMADDAAIVSTELATNALRHTSSSFRVVLEWEESAVQVAVHDVSTALPVRRHPGINDEGGRGVALVESLSTEWGAELLPDGGKVVWSRLPHRGR